MKNSEAPLNVAVAGLGFMGGTHVAAYRRMPRKARLVALCDPRRERMKALDPEGRLARYASLEALLKDPSVEVVDLCLPTHLHAWGARLALQSGRHVVCEKPLARAARQAEGLARLAARSRGRLMTAQVVRFWPEYRALERIARERSLGRLKTLSLTRLSPRPDWSWKNWLHQPAKSGGALLDLHVHDVDFALHLLGTPESLVAQGRVGPEGGIDHVWAQYRYPGGIRVGLEGGWGFPAGFPFRMAFVAAFTGGSLEYCSARLPRLTAFPAGGKPFHPPLPRSPSASGPSGGNLSSLGGYFLELEHFMDSLRGAAPAGGVTPGSAALAVRLVELEERSIRTGRAVRP